MHQAAILFAHNADSFYWFGIASLHGSPTGFAPRYAVDAVGEVDLAASAAEVIFGFSHAIAIFVAVDDDTHVGRAVCMRIKYASVLPDSGR